MSDLITPDYSALLSDIKGRIRTAQIRAASSVNRELVALYLEIGKLIVHKQEQAGWGDAVVDQLARDLRHEFPDITGFSRSNIFAMRQVYVTYRSDEPFVQQLVGQIPWGHNLLLMAKIKDSEQRTWYLQQTIAHGWSRAVLEHQIESGLYQRQVEPVKTSNFALTLPPPQSDLARQILKDTYVFDFLSLGKEAEERDLERALVEKIKDFLLELGAGFAFVGSQYHLEVGGQDYFIDLLFYHHRLRCLVAIELKMQDFIPEVAGKMNFYLAVLNDTVRHPDDAPSIGIILCRGRNRMVVEYALQDMGQPIGVADYRHTKQLPSDMAQALPTAADFERVLDEAEPHPPAVTE